MSILAHRPPVLPAPGSPQAFAADVMAGLACSPRSVPCTWLYDEHGSALYDRVTETADYYPSRAETAALATHGREVAAIVGGGAVVVEVGAGSCLKTRLVLDALDRAGAPAVAYVPVDVSAAHLARSAARLAEAYPALAVRPVVADLRRPFDLPDLPAHRTRCVLSVGSTLGNETPGQAARSLARMADLAGPGGSVVVGVDLVKDRATLVRAYDDGDGVTAAFNLNLLCRMARELGAAVDPGAWAHLARYDAGARRVEMHLVSRRRQGLTVGDRTFLFERGQSIWTESAYKYTAAGFRALATQAGLRPRACWTDPDGLFSVHALRVPGSLPKPGAPAEPVASERRGGLLAWLGAC